MIQMDDLIQTPTAGSTIAAYDAFLDKLGDRDRLNVQRHVAFGATEPTDVHELVYEIGAAPGDTLRIGRLTAGGSTSAPDYYKHMLGWTHRAMKITLPLVGQPATIQALLALCVRSTQTSNVSGRAGNSH